MGTHGNASSARHEQMSRRGFMGLVGAILGGSVITSLGNGAFVAQAAEITDKKESAAMDSKKNDASTTTATGMDMSAEACEHFIVPDIQWVESLPDHEGSIGGKGFPILMNGDLVPEANAWVCPTMFEISEEMSKKVAAGSSVKANRHTHPGDEMYLILGPKGAIEYEITLGDGTFTLSSPCCVYIPAGLPHSICPTKYTAGVYGGSCQIYLGKDYVTLPVEE